MFIQNSRLSVLIALFAWVNCESVLFAQVVYTQVPARVATKSAQVSHMDRAMAALSIARSSAEAKLLDVSFEAVRRAVGKGPPVASVELGGLLGGRPRPGATINPIGSNPAPTASTDIQFAKELVAISDLWAKQNADAEKCYLLFKEIVFPASRPNEAFLYTVDQSKNSNSIGSVSLEMPAPPAIGKCGAQCLIEWAAKCDKVADVRTLIDARAKMPGSAAASTVMSLLLALQTSKTHEDTEGIMNDISTRISTVLTSRESELVLSKAIELARELPPDSPVITTFHSAVLNGIKSNNRSNQNRFTNYFLVERLKQAIEADDPKQTEMVIDVVRRQWDTIRAGNGSFVASMEGSLYQSAAQYAMSKDNIALGFDLMKRGIENTQAGVEYARGASGGNSLVDIGNSVTKKLLAIPLDQRYEGMKQFVWSLPLLGLHQHSTFMPIDSAPRLFSEDSKSKGQFAPDGLRSTSLIQWHIRDAIACGKLEEVRAKIESLRAANSDDAEVAQMVLTLAQGELLDATGRIDNSVADKPTLKRVGQSGTGPMVLEIEMASAALKSEKTRDAGLNFIRQLVETGVQVSSTDNLAWARRVLFDAEQANAKEPVRPRHTSLVHWIPSDDNRITNLSKSSLPANFWLEREPGKWGNESGSPKEHLFLKYPLIGDFEIEVSGLDGALQQSSLGFLGATFDFLPSNNQVLLVTGFYQPTPIEFQWMKANEWNSYRFKRTGRTVELLVNEQTVKSLQIPADQPLFFTYVAGSYRRPTYSIPLISGAPTIPRSVMLSEPNLLCWSASLKGQSLPRLDLIGGGEGRIAATKLSNGDVYYDYEFVDSEIRSIDHFQLIAEAEKNGVPPSFTATVPPATLLYKERREGWLFCVRPLHDGERVDMEFYQEMDKFTVAPTLGRVAMLLDKPKIDLHWVTMESNGEYFGIQHDNRRDDPNAEQFNDVVLKEKDWNQLSMKLEQGIVTLEINGRDVYRRKWETNFYHKFGVFHNPMQTQVRIRNVRLSGNWPEKLPANLMEMTQ